MGLCCDWCPRDRIKELQDIGQGEKDSERLSQDFEKKEEKKRLSPYGWSEVSS